MQKQGPDVGRSNVLLLEMLYLPTLVGKEIPIKRLSKEIQKNTQEILDFRLILELPSKKKLKRSFPRKKSLSNSFYRKKLN